MVICSPALFFEPEADNVKGVVIICNALGVEQQFYHKFAQYLCERHFTVLTFDYRGTGRSKPVSFSRPLSLADWGRQDIDAVIRHAATLPGAQNIFLAGHSVGGTIVLPGPARCQSEGRYPGGGILSLVAAVVFSPKFADVFFLSYSDPCPGRRQEKIPFTVSRIIKTGHACRFDHHMAEVGQGS